MNNATYFVELFPIVNFLNAQFCTKKFSSLILKISKILRTSMHSDSASGAPPINSRSSRLESVRRSFKFDRNFFAVCLNSRHLLYNVGERQKRLGNGRDRDLQSSTFLSSVKVSRLSGISFDTERLCPSFYRHLRRHLRISLPTERLVINRRTY